MTGRPRIDERLLAALALAGAVASAIGLAETPERTWAGVLVASLVVTGLSLAGPTFIAVQYACGATWATAIRRVPEAMSAALPIGAAGLFLVFAVRPDLYPWMRAGVALHGFEGWWLQPGFFWARSAAYVALWATGSVGLRRALAAIEHAEDPRAARARVVRWSVGWLLVFAPTLWLASVDWIMSLEPGWHSTIFGVYQFAGLFASGLAAIALLLVWERRRGALAEFLRPAHLHDLGKLLFAFSTFWMYIWFSQYLLVWYANIPDEAAYFVRRRTGGWLPLFYLNIGLNWAVPFVPLLSALAKRRGRILGLVAAIMLLGRWLDLYLMVVPAVESRPALGSAEWGPALLAAAAFVWRFERAFGAGEPVPRRDPALAASLSYES